MATLQSNVSHTSRVGKTFFIGHFGLPFICDDDGEPTLVTHTPYTLRTKAEGREQGPPPPLFPSKTSAPLISP